MMSMFQIVVGCLFMTFFLYIVMGVGGLLGGGGGGGGGVWLGVRCRDLVLTQVTPDYN